MPNSSHTTIPASNVTSNGKAIVIRFVKQSASGSWSTHYAPAYNSSKGGLLVILKSETADRTGVERVVTRKKKTATAYLAHPNPKGEFKRMAKGASLCLAELQEFTWERPAPEPDSHDELSASEDEFSSEDNVVSIDTARAESEEEATVVEEAQDDALACMSKGELLLQIMSNLQGVPDKALAEMLAGMMSVK